MAVAFYSYKGGVGRSMLMANVGWILATSGLNVLLIDCDLEAPGLAKYFPDGGKVPDYGFLDLVESLSRRNILSQSAEDWNTFTAEWSPTGTEESPVLSEHVQGITLGGTASKFPGKLDVMPAAGETASIHYANRIFEFGAREFDTRYDLSGMLTWLVRKLHSKYDLVLVDCRTGFSEIGRIMAGSIADSFVCLVAPNSANLEGTEIAIEQFTEQWKRRDDHTDEPKINLVASRIEAELLSVMQLGDPDSGLPEAQKRWLAKFNSLAGSVTYHRETILPRTDNISGMEHLVCEDWNSSETSSPSGGQEQSNQSAEFGTDTIKASTKLFERACVYISRVLAEELSERLGDSESHAKHRCNRALACLSRYFENPSNRDSIGDGPEDVQGLDTTKDSGDQVHAEEDGEHNEVGQDTVLHPRWSVYLLASRKWLQAGGIQVLTKKDTGSSKKQASLDGEIRLLQMALDSSKDALRPIEESQAAAMHLCVVFPPASAFEESSNDQQFEELRKALQLGTHDGMQRRFTVAVGWPDLSGYELVLRELSKGDDVKIPGPQDWFNMVKIVEDVKELVSMMSAMSGSVESGGLQYPYEIFGQEVVLSSRLGAHIGDESQKKALIKENNRILGFEDANSSAEKWWNQFSEENSERPELVIRLQQELILRSSTITEFFLAYVYSNTDNILANLYYLDYTRLKKRAENKRQMQDKDAERD